MDSLEQELDYVAVDRGDWKRTLVSKLTIGSKGIVRDLIVSDDYTYDNLRERLLNRTGISPVEAGIKIFHGWGKSFSDENQKDQVSRLIKLMKRYFSRCTTKRNTIIAATKALYGFNLTPNDQAVLDGRDILTPTDLYDAINTIQTMVNTRTERGRERP